MTDHRAYLSIGSNLGKPLENCCRGIKALCRSGSVRLLACSPFYRTEPVDYPDQSWFVNAALHIETRLTPLELLAKTREIQVSFGRKAGGERFGPRVLDLDIIFFEGLQLETAELTIPHPRMHKRRFVLQPICDIDPTVMHPALGKNVQELLNQLVTDGQGMQLCSSGCSYISF